VADEILDNDYILELKLLSRVRKRCFLDPGFLTKVIQAGVAGIQEYADTQSRRAADMETFASAMAFLQKQERLSPKLKKQMNDLALAKLEKWMGKTSLRWDDDIIKKE